MNYYAVERSTDHLAHYGVKGMRWGVRKAIARGDTKAVERHYAKAAKKLAKLQDIGLNSKKYAKRAAAYGVAAVGTGTIAIDPKFIKKPFMKGSDVAKTFNPNFKENLSGIVLSNPHHKVAWLNLIRGDGGKRLINSERSFDNKESLDKLSEELDKNANARKWVRGIAGGATLGLGAAAGLNAYRAANGPKYRQKAREWKNTMDSAFEGTKYSGKYSVPNNSKKRKRR